MATFGGSDEDIERLIDEWEKQFEKDNLGRFTAPGFLTVAQVASLFVAHYNSENKDADSASISNALGDFVRLICMDVSDFGITAKHPITRLSWEQYSRMLERGMYDSWESPAFGMDWLIEIPEVERWYKTKGIEFDLSVVLAEMLEKQLINPSGTGGNQADDSQAAAGPLQKGLKTGVKQSPVAVTGQSVDEEYASWFDDVGYQQLAGLFKEYTDLQESERIWKAYTSNAHKNGLKEAAKSSRTKYNPFRAGMWWLNSKHPTGWTLERLYRTLAKNLPARSKGNESRLTGDDYN